MSTFADAHQGGIVLVRHEGSVYTAGWRSTCTCGWQAGDVRTQQGTCLLDHWAHLSEARATTKETA